MAAFGKLPFQFQQRGDVLAATVAKQDHKTLSQHLTKRDQDLENYLSTLSGARVSLGTWGDFTPHVVVSGTPQTVNLAFLGGTGGFTGFGSDLAFRKKDGTLVGAGDLYPNIFDGATQWADDPGNTTSGFAYVGGTGGSALLLVSSSTALSQATKRTQVNQLLPAGASTIPFVVSVDDQLAGIQVTGPATMLGVTQLTASVLLVSIYVVD